MLLGIIRRKKKGRERKKKIFDKRKITKKGTVKIEAEKKKKKVLGMRPGVVVDRSAVKVIMTTWIGL